jgi:hypothetical protein
MTMIFGIPSLAVPGGNRLVAVLRELCGASGSVTTEVLAGSLNRSVDSVDTALKLAERMGLVERLGEHWRPLRTHVDLNLEASAPTQAAPAPSFIESIDPELHAEMIGLVVTTLYRGRPVPTACLARALGCDVAVAEELARQALHAGVVDHFFEKGWLPVKR